MHRTNNTNHTSHRKLFHANIAQTPSMDSTSQVIGGRRLS